MPYARAMKANKTKSSPRSAVRARLTARNTASAAQEAQFNQPKHRYEGTESAFKMAFTDSDFLLREELRPVRMQLELLKPELIQQEQGIEATIVIQGSARILPPDVAQQQLDRAKADGDAAYIRRCEMALQMSHYYEQTQRFAALVTEYGAKLSTPLYIVTGGGPGIMEAGNRGAFEIGGKSIGLNIALPHEQAPNEYITPELCFQFHYFALRKMHFLMRSVAIVCFPGGYGTLDELFEALTLIQTGKCRRRPVLLFGQAFWEKLVNIPFLLETGMISPGDEDLFVYVETAEQAWAVLDEHYGFSAEVAEQSVPGAHAEDT
jgi:uncharacterized protein (TIGR00730 family)